MLDKIVIRAEFHDEVSVTRIHRHPVWKNLAINEEGFIVLIISRKQQGKSYN
jgi:hypothetical protein